MADRQEFNILVSLGVSFYRSPFLNTHFARLAQLGSMCPIHDAEQFGRELLRADAWLGWGWPEPSREMLEYAPRLRWSGHLNLTLEGAMSLLDRGVAVSEARHCWSPAVAEMALGLILAGLRKTSDYHAGMRRGDEVWPFNDFPAQLDPRERELTGRPVGIVGFGGIGRRLAELLGPFRTPLYVHDPFVHAEIIGLYGATRMSLMDLIRASDVVVLCAADTHDARHLMGRDEIEALRRDAVLVNVGRAWLVDTPALVDRLKRGDVVAMLDVFDIEPLEQGSLLRTLPNAYLTPHRAGGLVESVQRGLDMLILDLEAYLGGMPMRYGLDKESAKKALGGK